MKRWYTLVEKPYTDEGKKRGTFSSMERAMLKAERLCNEIIYWHYTHTRETGGERNRRVYKGHMNITQINPDFIIDAVDEKK